MTTMTLADKWLARYYPETAADCYKRVGDDRLALLQHGLKKWRGLRPKVLQQYGLTVSGGIILIASAACGLVLQMGTDSCALCRAFFNSVCADCPLPVLRSDTRCSANTDDISPYGRFIVYSDPEPMIKLLERALRLEKLKTP